MILTATLASDPMWGPDKAKHLGLSAALVGSVYCIGASQGFDNPAAAAGLGLGVGLAKELWDMKAKREFSLKDLAWDALGVGVGLALVMSTRQEEK